MRKRNWRVVLISVILIVVVLLIVSGIVVFTRWQPSDEQAYLDVVATMSLAKAKGFFTKFPKSQYRDKLASDIITWCKTERIPGCFQAILDILPREHPRYPEILQLSEQELKNRTNSTGEKD